MGFNDIPKVEKVDFFLDVAFDRASKRSSLVRSTGKKYRDTTLKARAIECIRLETVKDTLANKLLHILKTFPSTDNLSVFYQQLLKCNLDFVEFKKSLGALNWAIKKIKFFWKEYRHKIQKCNDSQVISNYRRQYYGRVSSVMKQIKNNLAYLDECRKVMRKFPIIKQLATVAIVGFPNVGKTTLLSKLTGSKPEIASYAFTTKGINVGYIGKGKGRTQVLDTPGTLDRFEKMNNIEKQAYLAMKLVADNLIYVFDPTESYPLIAQDKLFKKISKLGKQVTVYISKSDIAEKDIVSDLKKKYKGITSLTQLKKAVKL